MWEFINYFEVKQLIEDNPEQAFIIFLLVTGAIVTLVYALAQFRLFSIVTVHEHHHHHYHPASTAPQQQLPPERQASGYYRPSTQSPTPEWMDDFTSMLFNPSARGEAATPQSTQQPAKSSKNRSKMSKAKRFRILRRDSFRCRLCGRGVDDAEGLTLQVDHRMPIAKGGTDDEENLWTLCDECNGAKSDTIMEELFDAPADAESAGEVVEQDGDK